MEDQRDWVRVVAEQRCEDCGLEAAALAEEAIGHAIKEEGDRWAVLLGREDADDLHWRAHRRVWSALEYAAHVRDVLALFAERIRLALSEHEPHFGWWDHEAAAVEDRYNEQEPLAVAEALRAAAQELALALPPAGDGAWLRRATRRGRERFTVEGLARFALHEARHHRIDAERGLPSTLRSRSGPAR